MNRAALLKKPSWPSVVRSVHGAGCRDLRVELDLAKRALVIRDVLLQDGGQRLGLLWAKINPLKVAYLDLILRLLLHGAENQEEVPHVDPHLHAVSVGLAIVGRDDDIEIGLSRDDHDVG